MKTSEFIRAAVDAHLSPDCVSREVDKERALCFVFQAAVRLDPTQRMCAFKAANNVLQALNDVTRWHSIIAGYLQATDPAIYLGDDGKNIQAVRFMLADFIALMLEDEGD